MTAVSQGCGPASDSSSRASFNATGSCQDSPWSCDVSSVVAPESIRATAQIRVAVHASSKARAVNRRSIPRAGESLWNVETDLGPVRQPFRGRSVMAPPTGPDPNQGQQGDRQDRSGGVLS